jgi:hypothetical protein
MAGLFHHGPKNVIVESTLLISDMIIIPHRPQGREGEGHLWKGYRSFKIQIAKTFSVPSRTSVKRLVTEDFSFPETYGESLLLQPRLNY